MRITALLIVLLAALPVCSSAEIDLDREVLIIPDTHNEKPYIWNVAVNPGGYELIIERDKSAAGTEARFSFDIKRDPAENIKEMHLFITDSDLHFYRHLRPTPIDGKYVFSFNPPRPETYRFEIVFKTEKGWVNLKRKFTIKGETAIRDERRRDEGYSAKVKLIPRKVYAEHVVTFLFELAYKGIPVRDLEKMDGADMQLASWDEDLKEFIYVVPKQNLGGPEVALSAVFMKPGRRAVFAEFKHNGEVQSVEIVIDVFMEPPQGTTIENLKPSDN
jgi:hypothetical protein